MTITPQPGHWYERRDGQIVTYESEAPNGRLVLGGIRYAVQGRLFRDIPTRYDLVKDLGTTDPCPKKRRKKPVKKTRKVRMYFYRDGDASVHAIQWKDAAERYHNAQYGRIFSRIINIPILVKKKA